jgi:hypothetical protein
MNLAKEMPSNNIVEVNCFEELYAIFPSEHCRKFSDGAEAVVLNFADYTIIGLSAGSRNDKTRIDCFA